MTNCRYRRVIIAVTALAIQRPSAAAAAFIYNDFMTFASSLHDRASAVKFGRRFGSLPSLSPPYSPRRLPLDNHSVRSHAMSSMSGRVIEEPEQGPISAITTGDTNEGNEMFHNVDGVICREVHINLNVIGPVTILEATADSQDTLVDMALTLEDEEPTTGNIQLNVGDPYGAVLWPAASATANHLLAGTLEGRTVLELGAGTGLISMAAALGGAKRVIATDYESIPLRLLEVAKEINGCDNEEKVDRLSNIETVLFDIGDHETPLPDADIIIAADIMYEPATGRAMALRTAEALKRGSRVLIGCSPGRPGRPAFHEELRRIVPGIRAKFVDAVGTTCSGPRHELICGEGSGSVSVEPKLLKVKLMDLDPRKCMMT